MLLCEHVPGWPKFARAVERTDMKMRLGRQPHGFAGQCRSASTAKPASGSSRRRIELGYLTLRDRISRAFKRDKNRSGCAGMLAATLAVAPIYALRLTGCGKPDRAAQTATFELFGSATHL